MWMDNTHTDNGILLIYTHTHTMEYYSSIKKELNSVICSNVDGPRGYYA